MRRAFLSSLASSAESGMTSAQRTSNPILSFPPRSASEASTELQVRHSTASTTPSSRHWARTPSWPNWARGPNAIVAAALLTVVTLALAAVISRLGGQDSSSGSGNVVRTATVALVPAPQPTTAPPVGSNRALSLPPSQAPSLIPDDTHPPVAAPESELRARPATVPSPAPPR
jgi:hypothetical protein